MRVLNLCHFWPWEEDTTHDRRLLARLTRFASMESGGAPLQREKALETLWGGTFSRCFSSEEAKEGFASWVQCRCNDMKFKLLFCCWKSTSGKVHNFEDYVS